LKVNCEWYYISVIISLWKKLRERESRIDHDIFIYKTHITEG